MKKLTATLLALAMMLTLFPLSGITVFATEGGYTAYVQNGKAYISGYSGSSTDLVIPAECGGKPVVGIQNNAFWNNGNITSVVLPEGLTSIGEASFSWCKNLKKVTCPESLKTIGDGAFKYCDALTSINFPFALESIGHEAFISCFSLTGIILQGNVHTVGPSAFSGCSNVSVLKLSGSLQEIRPGAFAGLGKVKEIEEPAGVTKIHNFAFAGCTQLTTLTLPATIKEIHDNIAENCKNLTTVYYGGTRADKENIWMTDLNKELLAARWKCVDDPVSDPVSILIQPPAVAYARQGKQAVISVTADGDNLTYEWYQKRSGFEDFTPTDVVSKTFAATMNTANHKMQVYCVITDGDGNQVQTITTTLRRQASITKESATAAYGAKDATVKATVTAVGDGLKYQWYVKNDGASKYSKSSVTKATYSAKMAANVNNRRIYCVVTDQYGKSVQSKTFILRETVSITTQPKTAYAQLNKTVAVTVKASGEGLKYTWYIKSAGAKSYTQSSVKKSTYSVTMNSGTKDRRVYCVVTDAYGKTAQTKTVILRQAATVTTQPKSVTVKKNATAKITVKASGDGLKYTWYIKNAGASKYSKSSVKKATYSTKMTAKSNGRRVYCVITDAYGKTVRTKTVILKMK